jgi:hypothetical protein
MNLEGTWHVVATNFPMWTKGKRTKPRFTYSNLRAVHGVECFDDTVSYEEGGRTKTIVGVDTSDGPRNYVWRGRGWLRFFTSRWEIISVSADEQCLALSFTKTLFTPAGFDIISRSESVSDDVYASMLAAIGSPSLIRLK